MAEIVGTITNLSDFLSKTQVCLSVKPNDPQQQIICLEADRKYSIPAFQREVRWDDNNLKMLLYDLSRSSKFLGNIILTIKSDHTCEIIDGQQRTTVLMLIVSCIKKKFGTKISTPDLCPLRNEGFTGFQTLLEKAFDQEAITSDDWNAILKSDDYLQLPRIQKLWNTISSSELLADRHKAQGLLDNLCKSEFNIIASYSNDVNTSIQYFLDVNLKGIRLDTEDIFKGYLFSQDSRELTRSLWQKNKRDVLRLNGVTQSSEEKRYPLMKLYEHFFYCDLYLPREGDCEYSTLKFTQLALVNKTAVNKLEEFESLISQRPELLQKCIIFVQTMEYGAKLQEILVRYSDKYHTYYADDEKINLENFAAGKIDCLLTCKKVSEGIDISSVTNIILFSSDRSRLVTTQRIGRALRLDKNNPEKKATVVDFVIEDSEENDNNADADRAEWLTELSQTRRCEHEK